MAYNPNIHHRRSIRLKGHDYSQPGLYFITICCHNRQCLFGEIVGAENFLPDIYFSDKIFETFSPPNPCDDLFNRDTHSPIFLSSIFGALVLIKLLNNS